MKLHAQKIARLVLATSLILGFSAGVIAQTAQPATAAASPSKPVTKPVTKSNANATKTPAAAASASASKFEAASALNKAARQPMLAERITKSFNMINQKVLETRAKRQLEDGLKEFDLSLKQLLATSPTPEIRENYELLDQLFGEYKNIKNKPATIDSAKELAEQNEELVYIAEKGAALVQIYTKSARNDLIATAGDVRTLSQRIAKLYLFRSAGIRSDVIAADLKKAETQYRTDIDRLLRATQNSPEIKNELALAEGQWLFLKKGIERLEANKTSPIELEFVVKSCDNILEVMDRVTKLYEAMKV